MVQGEAAKGEELGKKEAGRQGEKLKNQLKL